MTLGELKEYLATIPENCDGHIVILQKDAEGNGYSPLSGVDHEGIYEEENTWSGSVLDSKWSAEEAAMEPDEWEEFKKENPKCVVLFPIN